MLVMTRSNTMSVCSVTGPKFSVRPTKNATFLAPYGEYPAIATPRHGPTQPSTLCGRENDCRPPKCDETLRLGSKKKVWLIQFVDKKRVSGS